MLKQVKAQPVTAVYAKIRHADGSVTDCGRLTRTPWHVRLFRKVMKSGK